jgi:hypothetical protein
VAYERESIANSDGCGSLQSHEFARSSFERSLAA